MKDVRAPREWSTYRYIDPKKILIGLRDIATTFPLGDLRYEAASLRTRELRCFGEGRQAALFCYGISCALGIDVSFAQVERQDYDIVARYVAADGVRYVPVQLKEWVPDAIPNAGSLQKELNKLSKYADSANLVIAFHLNRTANVQIRNWFYQSEKLPSCGCTGQKIKRRITGTLSETFCLPMPKLMNLATQWANSTYMDFVQITRKTARDGTRNKPAINYKVSEIGCFAACQTRIKRQQATTNRRPCPTTFASPPSPRSARLSW